MLHPLLAVVCWCLIVLFGSAYSQTIQVKCDHMTPVCECPSDKEVCEFQLDIEMLQTFTRYEVDMTNGDSRGTAGRVWYIDNNGNYQPLGQGETCQVSINDPRCSQPFAVDGCTFRSFIAVNGRIPGPTLIVTQDQLVKVNVINRLASESISIHWHGMHQRKTNWMDGVEHITQCGIPPGVSFTYIFKAAQYGTHWYHSHSGAQRTDGLFGSLIVKEKDSTYIDELQKKLDNKTFEDLPADHTLSLLDWQKSNSIDLFTQIHSSIRYFGIENVLELQNPGAMPPRTESSDGAEVGPVSYWSGLINGKGRHKSVPYINSDLSIFKVSPSSMYRFRLVGAQSLFAYRFSIDRHKLIVIASDGQFVEPVEVDYIIIHSGERYDFLLETKLESELTQNNFAIRAVTLEIDKGTKRLTEANFAEAILYYNTTATPTVPTSSDYKRIANSYKRYDVKCTSSKHCVALNCPFLAFPSSYNTNCIHIHQLRLLIPLPDNQLPDGETDDKLFFNFGFEGTRQTSAINGRNLQLPSNALALLDNNQLTNVRQSEYCKGLDNDKMCDRDNREVSEITSPECFCLHVKGIRAGRSIQLVLSAVGPEPSEKGNFLFAHPIHLHGHSFHVVDIQFGEYDNNEVLNKGNSDISCGGEKLCTNPKWNDTDYSTGKSGKINSSAPLKDTILIPAGGYAVVYFTSDNPGWWFLHCHIEVHQLEGMGVIIDEGGNKNPAPSSMNQCGDFVFTVDQYKKATQDSDGYRPTGFMMGVFLATLLVVIVI